MPLYLVLFNDVRKRKATILSGSFANKHLNLNLNLGAIYRNGPEACPPPPPPPPARNSFSRPGPGLRRRTDFAAVSRGE